MNIHKSSKLRPILEAQVDTQEIELNNIGRDPYTHTHIYASIFRKIVQTYTNIDRYIDIDIIYGMCLEIKKIRDKRNLAISL